MRYPHSFIHRVAFGLDLKIVEIIHFKADAEKLFQSRRNLKHL